jgi:hypothetical protein
MLNKFAAKFDNQLTPYYAVRKTNYKLFYNIFFNLTYHIISSNMKTYIDDRVIVGCLVVDPIQAIGDDFDQRVEYGES